MKKHIYLILLMALIPLVVNTAQAAEPTINLTSQANNGGVLLTISGNDVPTTSEVFVTIFHPDGTKFGIFKVISTSQGAFSFPVEMVGTSKQGEYRIHAQILETEITKNFVYSGTDKISTPEIIIPEIVEPEVVITPTNNSTSINNSTSTNSTEVIPEPITEVPTPEPITETNWDVFIRELEPTDRLDLIDAIIRYLLS